MGSSPRTWGCFLHGAGQRGLYMVFPTHVGVFLVGPVLLPLRWRLPHARGGVSYRLVYIDLASKSSPRTWGCFRI